MKIGILGTGHVGQTVGSKLAGLGHEVYVGTRNVAHTMAITDPTPNRLPAISGWLKKHPTIHLCDFEDSARQGELLINATNGIGSMAALNQAGGENMRGKILMDISNPLDFSGGMPGKLTVCNTDSLGEQIQKTFPDVKVVKTLNTVTAALMVDPNLLANGEHQVFVCGNDGEAKNQVSHLLSTWFGWKHIIDLGDITNARGTEMYLPLWLRLWENLGTGVFNIQIVK